METFETALARYAEIRQELATLEAEQDMLSETILTAMQKSEVDKITQAYGTFSTVIRKTWKYTDKVKLLEETVKSEKALEQESGAATYEEKQSLAFRKIA